MLTLLPCYLLQCKLKLLSDPVIRVSLFQDKFFFKKGYCFCERIQIPEKVINCKFKQIISYMFLS